MCGIEEKFLERNEVITYVLTCWYDINGKEYVASWGILGSNPNKDTAGCVDVFASWEKLQPRVILDAIFQDPCGAGRAGSQFKPEFVNLKQLQDPAPTCYPGR